jgi:hypothetical protein
MTGSDLLIVASAVLIAVNVTLAVVYAGAWLVERLGLYRFDR